MYQIISYLKLLLLKPKLFFIKGRSVNCICDLKLCMLIPEAERYNSEKVVTQKQSQKRLYDKFMI